MSSKRPVFAADTQSLPRPLILGIGGTAKAGALSERALRFALRIAETAGAETEIVAGPELVMPMYEPAGERGPSATRLLDLLRKCNGLILSSPSYHGTLSGLLKNVLDYVEDMRRDDAAYLSGRCVGCLVCAGGPQAYGTTLLAMRSIIHTLRAWPTPMGVGIGGDGKSSIFDSESHCLDKDVADQIDILVYQVVNFARMRQLLLSKTGHVRMRSLFEDFETWNDGRGKQD